ncbi:TPA: AlpA family phage regulatory protein [Pseudomonas aeruginosa]|nr:AlpA family phage regulatory protein [Pseudomonas aeruginosa]MDV6815315.1 AlpA family phage regulatory protein [Pseudomonas aeruginosa]HBO5256679.1 AlpA family phage regulatory protein [Pseudomonas aeruginosa]HCA7624499.1 AlpA family phage regulatory protein [Pseudomonas aeruginosa]HCA7761621.1 AlpA family phage regulatory protein [Pseudomonas aeruginosa]
MLALIRQADVSRKFGAARPTIYEWMAEGLFPRPLKLGPKFAAWPEHECNAILAARIQGKSKDEIRALVIELTEARQRISVEVAG